MIKLIACDMDGTLLNDEKVLDSRLFDLIRDMKKRDIIFAAASGRQKSSLVKAFKPIINDVIIVPSNGACIFQGGKEINAVTIDTASYRYVLDTIYSIGSMEPLISCKDYAYTANAGIFKIMKSGLFGYDIKLVDNIYEIDEDIINISAITTEDVSKSGYNKIADALGGRYEVVISGVNCVDIGLKGTSKGYAVKLLQERFGIKEMETAVFGDNYNDIEMFKTAYYSYAMSNAVGEVKKFARFTAGNNNEGAVVDEIIKLIG